MLSPINSIKHFVARTNTGTTAGTTATLPVATAVVAPATASTDQVREGCVIKAVWIEMWVISDGTADNSTQCVMTLEKITGTGVNPTNTNMLNLQAYTNKKNILVTFQGLLTAKIAGANPMSPIRGWYKIPKGKQRFGINDRLVFNITTVAINMRSCGMFIYKEYY